MKRDILLIYGITFSIDLCILMIINNENLSKYDKAFCKIVLICHILFYYTLITPYNTSIQYLQDTMHAMVFICLFASIRLDCHQLRKLCLMLCVILQLLWNHTGRCILNRPESYYHNAWYGNFVRSGTLIITVQLALGLEYPNFLN